MVVIEELNKEIAHNLMNDLSSPDIEKRKSAEDQLSKFSTDTPERFADLFTEIIISASDEQVRFSAAVILRRLITKYSSNNIQQLLSILTHVPTQNVVANLLCVIADIELRNNRWPTYFSEIFSMPPEIACMMLLYSMQTISPDILSKASADIYVYIMRHFALCKDVFLDGMDFFEKQLELDLVQILPMLNPLDPKDVRLITAMIWRSRQGHAEAIAGYCLKNMQSTNNYELIHDTIELYCILWESHLFLTDYTPYIDSLLNLLFDEDTFEAANTCLHSLGTKCASLAIHPSVTRLAASLPDDKKCILFGATVNGNLENEMLVSTLRPLMIFMKEQLTKEDNPIYWGVLDNICGERIEQFEDAGLNDVAIMALDANTIESSRFFISLCTALETAYNVKRKTVSERKQDANMFSFSYDLYLQKLITNCERSYLSDFRLRTLQFEALRSFASCSNSFYMVGLNNLFLYCITKLRSFMKYINQVDAATGIVLEDVMGNFIIVAVTCYINLDGTLNNNAHVDDFVYLIHSICSTGILQHEIYTGLTQLITYPIFTGVVTRFLPFIYRDLFCNIPEVVKVTLNLVGDIACFSSVGFIEYKDLIPGIIYCIINGDPLVRPVALGILGDVALAIERSFDVYIPQVEEMLKVVVLHRERDKRLSLEYRKSVLHLLSCILVGMRGSKKINPMIYAYFINHISQDIEISTIKEHIDQCYSDLNHYAKTQ